MPCGTYVSQFVLQALYVGNPADHGKAALAVLTSTAKNTWVNMLRQGATTTMEMWTPNEKPNLTWSHVWSASPGFIIPWFLFGIQPLAPGWSQLAIKPAPGALEHGVYTLPTIKGAVSAHFEAAGTAGGGLRLTISLPPGTDAKVSIPLLRLGAEPALNGATTAVLRMDGVVLQRATEYVVEKDHWSVLSVGPGRHTFEILA